MNVLNVLSRSPYPLTFRAICNRARVFCLATEEQLADELKMLLESGLIQECGETVEGKMLFQIAK